MELITDYLGSDKNDILGNAFLTVFLTVYRFGNWIYYKVHIVVIRQMLFFLYRILDLIVGRIIANNEIPARCQIGKNVYLAHGGNGVIINGDTVIGDNVMIEPQVCIGNDGKTQKSPIIGNGVFIGVGARILGNIKIGDNVIIGANAVVISDIEANSVVAGIPARIIKTRDVP